MSKGHVTPARRLWFRLRSQFITLLIGAALLALAIYVDRQMGQEERAAQRSEVLQRISSTPTPREPEDSTAGARCVTDQFNRAVAAMQQHGDATPLPPHARKPVDSGRSPATP